MHSKTPKVDLFHAVDGGGNCLPGPSRPFGLVHVGPDMVNHNTSGYASGEQLRHFSHLHWNGGGGVGRYGCIGIVPMGQRPDARTIAFDILEEQAELGTYEVTISQKQGFGELYLPGKIKCAMTATENCAIHQYRWDTEQEHWIRIDLDTAIGSLGTGGWLRWQDSKTLLGRADYRGGWGHESPYSVFFRMEFSSPMEDCASWSKFHPVRSDGMGEGMGLGCRARAGESGELTIRVGISFVSVAAAQRKMERELNAESQPQSFNVVANESKGIWEALHDRYRVAGGTEADQTIWHSLWQRLHQIPVRMSPEDVPWFAANEVQFNDFACLWDYIRGAGSLMALVNAPHQVSICNALIEIGEQTGWIPDAWLMGLSGQIQGGCSAAVLFAEASRKRLPGFSVERAFRILQRNEETLSPDPAAFGRYPQWAEGSVLPDTVPNHVSRSLEYAFHDHCRAHLADVLGEGDVVALLEERAVRPWEVWHEDAKCFASKASDGTWNAFDPWKPACRDFWNDPHFYEGTAHDYTLGAWHLLPEIIERIGGENRFKEHLDTYMERCYHWKEINLHAPWLYHFVGLPEHSSEALKRIADKCVKPGRQGLTDNEDFGAWASWWIGQAMGLGVLPGSDRYLIGIPRFERIEIVMEGASRPLLIRREGSGKAIQSMHLNGSAHDRNWVTHDQIADGAEIVLRLGREGDWGREPAKWE